MARQDQGVNETCRDNLNLFGLLMAWGVTPPTNHEARINNTGIITRHHDRQLATAFGLHDCSSRQSGIA